MDPNPYRPSHSDDASLSILDLIRYLFSSKEQRGRARFARGYVILFEGIAFFVDPQNPSVLYAASPSQDFSDKRMNLIIAEVARLAPEFMGAYPYLNSLLVGRSIVVRLIEKYGDKQAEFVREEPLDLDLLG
ncbi:MAG: hypothetical protein Aurels2KO_21560 [Aureliella sp.]